MKNNVKTLSLCLGLASLALGQTTTAPVYTMSIFAGIPSGNSLGDGGPSVLGTVSSPQGIAVGSNGDIFIADNTNSRIRKIDGTTGIITTVALTNISNPNGMAFDSKGNLLVAQNGNNGQIIRVDVKNTDPTKSATVLMGTNVSGTFGGDGQYAYNSVLNSPAGVATDKNDNIYIADTNNNRVRMIKNVNNCIFTTGTLTGGNTLTNTCTVVTIAGGTNTPQFGTSCGTTNTCTPDGNNTVGDGGPALLARLNGPYGIAVAPDGSKVYVAQNSDHRVRVIDMFTGLISTLIGNCTSSSSATSGTNSPSGNPLVIPCPSGSFGSATSSGQGNANTTLGDGKPANQATLNSPRGLYLDAPNNNLYIADQSNNRIRVVNLSTSVVTTVIGGGSSSNTGDQGAALNSGLLNSLSLNSPYGVWVQGGLIYFVEQGSNKVRVADPVANTVKTLVLVPRSSGSGGPATQAFIGFQTSLASTNSPRVGVDPAGNVYVVESATNKIRKVTSDGNINDWAGTGTSGFSGDGTAATAARLNAPQQIAFDRAGNAYIADSGNNRIRKVDTNGIITTVVGRSQITTNKDCSQQQVSSGTCYVDKSNYVGDGTAPTNALLSRPEGVDVDPLGNLVIADSGHNSIRYADLTNNVITTIAGGQPSGLPNGPTDGRSALASSGQWDSTNGLIGLFNNPRGLAVDKTGNIYVADYGNSVMRELIPTNAGQYSLFSFYGSGSSSGTTPNIPTGTGSPSVPARIRISNNNATSVDVDSGGNIYVALAADNRVHIISADHSRVYVVAGGGSADTGLNYTSGNALNTQTPAVTGVAVDSNGVVYTADRTGVVRKLVCTANCLPLK